MGTTDVWGAECEQWKSKKLSGWAGRETGKGAVGSAAQIGLWEMRRHWGLLSRRGPGQMKEVLPRCFMGCSLERGLDGREEV